METEKSLTLRASSHVGISSVTSEAIAITPVISCTAISVGGAVTGVYALLLPAVEVVWAVRVRETLVLPALSVRITLVTLDALAPGSVPSGHALSICAALLKETCILALPLDAHLRILTFIVTSAASCKTKSLIRQRIL